MAGGTEKGRETVIVGNIGLVISIASAISKKYKFNETDELIEEGMLGLIRAVDMFDLDNGAKFSTYAYHWIRRFMILFIESDWKNKATLHFESDDFREMLEFDYKITVYQTDYHMEDYDVLTDVLNKKEKIVVDGIYKDCKLMSEIGKEIGLSRERIRQLKNSAMWKMEKRFRKDINLTK